MLHLTRPTIPGSAAAAGPAAQRKLRMHRKPAAVPHMQALSMHASANTQQDGAPAAAQQSEVLSGAPAVEAPAGPDYSWRWILAMTTAAIFICYADRSNISVAILEMANEFKWDESFQGTVLSAFFLGYAGTQLIGGTLADRYGGKTVLTAGVLCWSAFTFLTPDAAMLGSGTLISCRVLMGLGEVRLRKQMCCHARYSYAPGAHRDTEAVRLDPHGADQGCELLPSGCHDRLDALLAMLAHCVCRAWHFQQCTSSLQPACRAASSPAPWQ